MSFRCWIEGEANKIMASDYFTTTPEMKAPVEVAAAAGNYVPFQVPFSVPVQVDDSVAQFQPKVHLLVTFIYFLFCSCHEYLLVMLFYYKAYD